MEEKIEKPEIKSNTNEVKPEVKSSTDNVKPVSQTTSGYKKPEGQTGTGYKRPDGQTRRPYSGSGQRSGRPGADKFAKGGRKKFGGRKNFVFRKRVCFFCKNKDAVVDYKDVGLMKRFVAESGKISPRRFTGTCAKHQKKLSVEIKKSRQMALLIFTDKHK